MSDKTYESEVKRIYEENQDKLWCSLESFMYSPEIPMDDIHDAAEALVMQDTGVKPEDMDEHWIEDNFDLLADYIVPMRDDIAKMTIADYLNEPLPELGTGREMATTAPKTRRAAEVLGECAKLMEQKGAAYNGFPQAEYYPYGMRDIWYMCFTKVKRLESQIIRDGEHNFESIEDSARDLINYAAFLVEFAEGKMDGQGKK